MPDIYHAITVTPLPGKEAGFPDFALFEQVAQDELEPYLIDFDLSAVTTAPLSIAITGWSAYDRSMRFYEWLQITTECYPVQVVFELEFNDGEGLNERTTWADGKKIREEEARMTDVRLDALVKAAELHMNTDPLGDEDEHNQVSASLLADLLQVLS